jgi:hypothetical protein
LSIATHATLCGYSGNSVKPQKATTSNAFEATCCSYCTFTATGQSSGRINSICSIASITAAANATCSTCICGKTTCSTTSTATTGDDQNIGGDIHHIGSTASATTCSNSAITTAAKTTNNTARILSNYCS